MAVYLSKMAATMVGTKPLVYCVFVTKILYKKKNVIKFDDGSQPKGVIARLLLKFVTFTLRFFLNLK